MATAKLRAVGYCRTSGESQRDNTSIPTQRKAIETHINRHKWKFLKHYIDECKSGSKIAGRDAFQQMMRDAASNRFDVLVVYNINRFSRDGFDILASSKTLKTDFGIDVISTIGDFDTRERSNIGRNFMSAAFAEMDKQQVILRLNQGKLELAAKNVPATGILPYGRTYDRKLRQWGIDKEKKRVVKEIAKKYLAGGELPKLAAEYGLSYASVYKILMHRSGTEWTVNFNDELTGKPAPVTYKVPELLAPATIKRVIARAQRNKSRPRTNRLEKFEYLLSGYIFCDKCGYKITPTTNHRGNLYYRHGNRHGAKECTATPRPYVRADQAELAVVQLLFDLFGNAKGVERAIREAMPDSDEVNELGERFQKLQKDLDKLDAANQRLVDAVADGTFSKEQIAKKSAALVAKQTELQEEMREIAESLGCKPSKKDIQAVAKVAAAAFKKRRYSAAKKWQIRNKVGDDFAGMTWKDKRDLIESVFSRDTDTKIDGRQPGIYVAPIDGQIAHRRKKWRIMLRGLAIGDRQCVTQLLSC